MYRIRSAKKYNDNIYRKTLEGTIRHGGPEGAVVQHREYEHANWVDVGVAKNGEFYEGQKYINAFMLRNTFHPNYFRKQFLTTTHLWETGEISFPQQHCGHDNCLSELKHSGTIEEGPLHYRNKPDSGLHHYVLTQRGRKNIQLCRELFL